MQPTPYADDASYNPYREPPSPPTPSRVSALDAVKFGFSPEGGLETLLLGVLFLFIPIVGPIALKGYQAEVFQRLVRRHPTPLPRIKFSDFGTYIHRGIATFVVELLVTLPLVFALLFAFGVAAAVSVATAEATGEDSVTGLVVVGLILFGAAMTLPLAPLFNAGITRAALTEDVSRSLDLRAVFNYFTRTFGTAVFAMIAFGLLAMGVVFVGLLGFVVCIYPAVVVVQFGVVHLRWQIYERYLETGGEAIALKPEAFPAAPAYPAGYVAHGYGGYETPPNVPPAAPPRYPGR